MKQTALRQLEPYIYPLALGIYVPLCLSADAHLPFRWQQDALGLLTFLFLLAATRFSSPQERRQVWLLVCLATGLEIFSSLLWGVYRYRWGNVPLYVPPGHGLIYLFALRFARLPLVTTYSWLVRTAALWSAGLWALAGLTLEPLLTGHPDVAGALLWPVFAWFLAKRSGPIYAGAFLATSALELLGTGFGDWTWASWLPQLHIPDGNPPSVIAGVYCLLDATTLALAARLSGVAATFRCSLTDLRRRAISVEANCQASQERELL